MSIIKPPRSMAAALAVIAIGLTGCSATGGAPTHTAVVQIPVATVAPIVPTQTPAPRIVHIGDTVQNGSMQFVVRGVRTASQVTDQIGGRYTAGGKYIIVTVTATNASNQAVLFSPLSQSLILQGYTDQVKPELGPTVAANPNGVADLVQPGQSTTEDLVFNVVTQVQPDAILLLDPFAFGAAAQVAARVELS